MANPFTTFIQNRFIQPVVQRQFAALEKDTRTFAVGASALPQSTIRDAIGQPHDTDYALLYAIYGLHADVAACVNRWAGGVTGNGWHIGLMDEGDEPTDAQRRRIAEITLWLKNPNPHKRFNLILHETTSHLAVSGDAYWHKVKVAGKIKELWPIHPATMRVKATEHGEITGYVQRINGKDAAHFDVDEILHFRLASITNDLYGHSPLESILEEVGTDLQALRSNRALFENGLAPSAILKMKDVGDRKKAEDVTKMVKQVHTGTANRHKLLTLFGVEGIEQYGHSLKDMEFTLLRSLTTDKVATAYGLPSLFLNQKGAARFATADTEERFFYNTTIKPLQDQEAEAITEEVIHEIDPELKFSYNEPNFADPDQMRRDALEAQGKGILDDNEVRTRYFDFPAREEEDRPAPRSAAPKTTPEAPNETSDAPNPSDDADAPQKSHEGRFLLTLTKSWDPAWRDQETVQLAYKRAIDEIRERRSDRLDSLTATLRPKMEDYFGQQERDYLERLGRTFKRVRRATEDEAVAALLSGYAIEDQRLGILLQQELEESARTGFDEAKLQVNFAMGYTGIAPAVEQYLTNDALKHARGINATTREQLREQLLEGARDGEGIPELSQRIKSVFAQATPATAPR